MAMSSKRVMQRLEMSVDRQLSAGAVGVTMLTEVGDDLQVGDKRQLIVKLLTFANFN